MPAPHFPALTSAHRPLKKLALLLALCGTALPAHGQSIVVDQPAALPAGGTVNVGTFTPSSIFSAGPGFHFTQDVVIQSVSYDLGPGGARELSIRSLYGCSYNVTTPAGTECGVETEISSLYPGLRFGTLRVVTATKTFLIPVAFNSVGAEVAFTPGTLTSPVPGQTVTGGAALSLDAAGNLYLASGGPNVVTKVDVTTGAVSVVAGIPNNANGGNGGGLATATPIQYPEGVTVSPAGDVYIASQGPYSQNPVYKVDEATGIITYVNGIPSQLSGRNGPYGPTQYGTVIVDEKGDIFLSVPIAQELLEYSPTGTETPLVGGTNTVTQCNAAQYAPTVMAVSGGYVYFYSNYQVFKVSTAVSTCPAVLPVAGTGVAGNNGENGPATAAMIGSVSGLAVDAAGDVYLADSDNGTVRVVSAATGKITTVAGTGSPLPTVTVLSGLGSLALDPRGNLYVLGTQNGTVVVQKVDVSSSSLQFASTVVGQTSSDSPKAVTATNIGNNTLNAGAITISPNFAVDGASTCLLGSGTGPLAPGTSCTEAVDFKPTVTGALTGTLFAMTGTINLSGTATAPTGTTTVKVSPGAINFGTVMQGNSSGTWTINIANTGAAPLTLVGATLSDTTDFVLGGNCSKPIAAYSSCNVTVVFTPQTAGTLNGTLTLTDNAGSGTQVVSLTGVSTSSAPVISVSPASINFGVLVVGATSPTWTVNVANKGATALKIANIVLSDPVDYTMGGNCGSTVAAYSSCNITLVFSPKGVDTYGCELRLTTNAGPTDTVVVLTGVGVAPFLPVVNLSPSSINFGSAGVGYSSGTWTIYVGNSGPATLNFGSIVLSDTTNFVLGGNCGKTVAAYSSCNETVVFKPKSVGTFQGTITFTDNANPGTQTVTLTGVAPKPSYSVSATPAALTLKAGQTGQAAFTLTPVGGFAGTVEFACAGLPANAECSFAPASLTADGTDTPQVAQLTLRTGGIYSASAGSHGNGVEFASLAGLGALLLGVLGRRRRLGAGVLTLLVLLSAGLLGTAGCGAGALGGSTPVGVSTLTVTAKAAATATTPAASQQATLTVTITE